MKVEIMEIIIAVMFFLSFYGLITGRNAVKSIIYIGLMEIAVIMFFLSLGYESGIMPPIGRYQGNVADPLPQALMITAIVIGVAATAVILTMLISLCRQSENTDWDEVKEMHLE